MKAVGYIVKAGALLVSALRIFGQTYPTAPVTATAGALSCGIRLYTADQVQTWCYRSSVLVHNTISKLAVGAAVTSGFISGTDQVLFIVQQPTPAGLPAYQISTSDKAWQGGILALLGVPDAPAQPMKGICCFAPSPLLPFLLEIYALQAQ